MNILYKSALILVIIGAINWAVIGIFQENFIANIFGADTTITRIIYVIVGVAAIVSIGLFFLDLDERKHIHHHHV